MKLNLKQAQALDFLLYRINNNYASRLNVGSFSLIFKYENILYKGNFLNFDRNYVTSKYFDYDGSLENKLFSINDLLKLPNNFDPFRYRTLSEEGLPLFIYEMMNLINTLDLSSFDFNPVVYNVTDLTNNLTLPILYITPDCEIDFLSFSLNANNQ
ncbi:MAG: hypothetical protein RR460_07840 [Clostridium sp.]